uniref:Putative secreted protein n=1 Tax=Xenopsylla cheopis TaxID=163159 RepID=A0A6M2DGC1_XENCH
MLKVVMYWNANGIKNKIIEFEYIAHYHILNIIMLQETHPHQDVSLHNYNIRLSNISLPSFCLLKFASMYKALQSSYLAILNII